MNITSASLSAVLLFTVTATGCAGMSSPSALANNPLVQSIMKQVGATMPQAVGGSGALLNLAQNKLPAADASKLSEAIPGMKQIVEQSKNLGGFSRVNSMADAQALMSKLGLNSSQASQMPQAVAGYVESAAGPDLASTLQSIWR